jgi:hypothetical protein
MSNPLKYIYAQHVPVEDSITLLSNTTFTTLSTMVPLSGGDLSVVTDDGNSIFYQMS